METVPLPGPEHRLWELSLKGVLKDQHWAEDISGEGTYGRTLANPAVWLGQKWLTGTGRRLARTAALHIQPRPRKHRLPLPAVLQE